METGNVSEVNRRTASIRERAGKFAVRFFISDDSGDEELGGTLTDTRTAALLRINAWVKHGILP